MPIVPAQITPGPSLDGVEPDRIDLAFLFDPMMAVHTSNVDPLPHQISQRFVSLSKC